MLTMNQHDLGCVPIKESELAFLNLIKSRGCEIDTWLRWMALKFDSAAETPVKLQTSDHSKGQSRNIETLRDLSLR